MKFKYIFLSVVIIFGFIISSIGNKTISAKEELDLFVLASVMQDHDIFINEWSLHAREKLENIESRKDAESYARRLQQIYPDWNWSTESVGHNWKSIGVSQNEGNFKESIQIISTLTTNQAQSYIIYEVEGSAWKEQSKAYLAEEIQEKISSIFRGKPVIFSCIKGGFNDKMNEALPYYVSNLLDAFNAKEIEALKEESFISTSAYTPMFAERIETNKEAMNLQLAIRTEGLGGKTNIIVGTPIITIEY